MLAHDLVCQVRGKPAASTTENAGFPIPKGLSMNTYVATGQNVSPLGQMIIKGQTDRIPILLVGLEQL